MSVYMPKQPIGRDRGTRGGAANKPDRHRLPLSPKAWESHEWFCIPLYDPKAGSVFEIVCFSRAEAEAAGFERKDGKIYVPGDWPGRMRVT